SDGGQRTGGVVVAVDPNAVGPPDRRVEVRPALGATVSDVLAADAYLLGTPANLGYMSGAMKHFFDTIYYPVLDATVGRPYGVWVHGNDDTAGALSAIGKITTGLRWKQVHEPVSITGPPDRAALDACRELAATVAASLLL
ncbi:MAG: flavodoxin family protein, partial [Acidimicrobiales bacterium]